MPRNPHIPTPGTPDTRLERTIDAWRLPDLPATRLRDRSYYGSRAYVYPDMEQMNSGDDIEARTPVDGVDSIIEFRVGRRLEIEDPLGHVESYWELGIKLDDELAGSLKSQIRPPIVVVPTSVFSSVRPYDKMPAPSGKSRGIGNEVDFDIDYALTVVKEPNNYLLRALKLRCKFLGELEDHIRSGGDPLTFDPTSIANYQSQIGDVMDDVDSYIPPPIPGASPAGSISLRGLVRRTAPKDSEATKSARELVQKSAAQICNLNQIILWADSLS